MPDIFHVNPSDLEWSSYSSTEGPADIRFKALTLGRRDVPGVQYIEYGPGQTDPVHHHDVGEFFIVRTGHLWVNDERVVEGGVVFVPPDVDYRVRAGAEGVEYFRIVVR
jgi:quercetin dioxygenase-like cupin family protein